MRSTCILGIICISLIVVPIVRAMFLIFTFKSMSRLEILVQKSLKNVIFHLKSENREYSGNFSKRSKISFQMAFKPYNIPADKILSLNVSVFDKCTALLILWDFYCRIDGKF